MSELHIDFYSLFFLRGKNETSISRSSTLSFFHHGYSNRDLLVRAAAGPVEGAGQSETADTKNWRAGVQQQLLALPYPSDGHFSQNYGHNRHAYADACTTLSAR